MNKLTTTTTGLRKEAETRLRDLHTELIHREDMRDAAEAAVSDTRAAINAIEASLRYLPPPEPIFTAREHPQHNQIGKVDLGFINDGKKDHAVESADAKQ